MAKVKILVSILKDSSLYQTMPHDEKISLLLRLEEQYPSLFHPQKDESKEGELRWNFHNCLRWVLLLFYPFGKSSPHSKGFSQSFGNISLPFLRFLLRIKAGWRQRCFRVNPTFFSTLLCSCQTCRWAPHSRWTQRVDADRVISWFEYILRDGKSKHQRA